MNTGSKRISLGKLQLTNTEKKQRERRSRCIKKNGNGVPVRSRPTRTLVLLICLIKSHKLLFFHFCHRKSRIIANALYPFLILMLLLKFCRLLKVPCL